MTRGSGQGQRCLDPPAPVRGGGCLGPADGGTGAAAHGVAVQVVPRARRFGERKQRPWEVLNMSSREIIANLLDSLVF